MARIIVITSGKGGVGKTTTSAALAMGLAQRGNRTAVIDFDVGLRNLDLIMGCERRVVYDFVNVINQEANLNQALIRDKRCDNLYVLPASQTRDKEALTKEGVGRVLEELSQSFDLHRLRLPGGHRARRHHGHVLRRRCRGGDQPRGLLRARLRPHAGHPGQQVPPRRDQRRAHQGVSAADPLRSRSGWRPARC